MAVVQDDLYIIAGYSNNKGYASSVWRLHLTSLMGGIDRVCSHIAIPDILHPVLTLCPKG